MRRVLVIALLVSACGGTSAPNISPGVEAPSPTAAPPTPYATPSPSAAPTVTVASPVGNARCAVTPEAVAAATIQWNMQVYGGNPTIKAGEAVAFITSLSHKPTVTEGTPAHTAVPQPCVDKELLAGRPLVVTFYKPGVYHLFCRKLPPAMNTVVTVQ